MTKDQRLIERTQSRNNSETFFKRKSCNTIEAPTITRHLCQKRSVLITEQFNAL
jgi:hypothetical protein